MVKKKYAKEEREKQLKKDTKDDRERAFEDLEKIQKKHHDE